LREQKINLATFLKKAPAYCQSGFEIVSTLPLALDSVCRGTSPLIIPAMLKSVTANLPEAGNKMPRYIDYRNPENDNGKNCENL
jgi:hypothetical protein